MTSIADRYPPLLTAGELANLLRVHRRQVYRLVSGGRCPPPLKIGRSARWSRAQIESWVENGCRQGGWKPETAARPRHVRAG